jgi:NADPH:quinone reductase-like Zn-dependent oxidoreductase
MKAIIYHTYGSPDVLHYEEAATPTPGENEVLIQVRAAAVNPMDWHFLRGQPYLIRMMTGLRRPQDTRLGIDVAGRVEAVGKNVTQFKPGDAVFGTCRGAFAEYACAAESALVLKPEQVTFAQAASAPVAALTALQGLRDKGRLQPGQKVLINGAAGGVGTFAVQIARLFGAEVTGVCSTRNVDLVRSLGAAQVIDYTQENFTKRRERYDLLFDCMGNHSLNACRRVLHPQGTYVMIGGPAEGWFGPLSRLLPTLLASRLVSQHLTALLTNPNQAGLTLLRELLATGKVIPVIDKRYPLREVPEALRHLGTGHARGKVVIMMAPDHEA